MLAELASVMRSPVGAVGGSSAMAEIQLERSVPLTLREKAFLSDVESKDVDWIPLATRTVNDF